MTRFRIAFVSAPSGNAYMAEILAAVAAVVEQQGVETLSHSGRVEDVDDGNTAFVVIPHEYFLLSPRPPAGCLSRTIAFGVEHPGTDTFAMSMRVGAAMAARLEISAESVREERRCGLSVERFVFGYSPRWDRWGGEDRERPVDLLYMGTADRERLQALAGVLPGLANLSTEVLIPPTEPHVSARADFLVGDDKWNLLSRSKLLLNLHRENKTAFEWIRALEAMSNGCVVLTEPSTDLGGLVAGNHLLIAERDELAARVQAATSDAELLRTVAAAAYRFCKEQLDMRESAERLVSMADAVLSHSGSHGFAFSTVLREWPTERPGETEFSRARWLPEPYPLPPRTSEWVSVPLTASRATTGPGAGQVSAESRDVDVDVIVVHHHGAGRVESTSASLSRQSARANLHLASLGAAPPRRPRGADDSHHLRSRYRRWWCTQRTRRDDDRALHPRVGRWRRAPWRLPWADGPAAGRRI